MPVLRLATRSSPLALRQAELVVAALARVEPALTVELVPMRSAGDRDHRAFSDVGERGIFVRDVEAALLEGDVEAAVHSCKDLALEATAGLELAALLPRGDARDVLCGTTALSVDALARGACIATSSVRRAAALRMLRADLCAVPIRGNVQTRIATSRARGDAACMLAAAGLHRLGLWHEAAIPLPVDVCVPEAGQGAIAVQVRIDCQAPWNLLDDPETRWAVDIERAAALALGGGCEHPVGVHVSLPGLLDVEPQGYAFTAAADGSSPQLVSLPLSRAMTAHDAAHTLVDAVRAETAIS